MALSFRSASDSTFDILSLIELFDTNFWEYYLFDLLGSCEIVLEIIYLRNVKYGSTL